MKNIIVGLTLPVWNSIQSWKIKKKHIIKIPLLILSRTGKAWRRRQTTFLLLNSYNTWFDAFWGFGVLVGSITFFVSELASMSRVRVMKRTTLSKVCVATYLTQHETVRFGPHTCGHNFKIHHVELRLSLTYKAKDLDNSFPLRDSFIPHITNPINMWTLLIALLWGVTIMGALQCKPSWNEKMATCRRSEPFGAWVRSITQGVHK